MITSPHNPKLKQIRALAGRPKARRETGLFLAEGIRLVEEALAANWPFAYALWSADLSARGQALVERLRAGGVPVEEVSPSLLQALSETESSQGLLAVLKLPQASPPNPETMTFVLIPDQIRDPGNLGTLIRTAAAAGADAVLIPPETTDPWAPKVVRAGMGAHFRLTVAGCQWAEIQAFLRGFNVFLADAGGQVSLWDANFQAKTALIIGGEAEGASAQARELANVVVNIPMPGKIESLNAGTAGAILLFEVVRQRNEVA
ncbi:MAG: RNA methyltransferase [Anaerolineales bacterium]|nr:RNA methyltransferase [Anaerolineales bacterium]MCX7755159.1 RNA methyltransferase [Anaerolineales bacterium]MDW8277825.1 RNA methyltransferase [Anaerolineales bacterium]